MEKCRITEEYEKLLKEKDEIIEGLKKQIETLTTEKEEMIESFSVSTNMLIEQIKDLESQRIGYRPQTANVLGKVRTTSLSPPRQTCRNNDLTAPYNQSLIPKNIRIKGDWSHEEEEKNSRSQLDSGGSFSQQEINPENDRENQQENELNLQINEGSNRLPGRICYKCQKVISEDDFSVHIVICCRNKFKCKVCSEKLTANRKMYHLAEWRNPDKILHFIEQRDLEKIKKAFEHGADVNYQFTENYQRGYLHYAVTNKWIELITLLVSYGVDIDPEDSEGNTPLILAVQQGSFQIAKSLIELGADIEAKNKISWNPLFYVSKTGDIEILNLLLEYDVDLRATTALGDNCLEIAQKNSRSELALILAGKGIPLRSGPGKGLPKIKS